MPDVISNTSPLQYLHQVDLLDLFPALFSKVIIPLAVKAELAEGQRQGVPLPALDHLPWIQIQTVHDRTLLPSATHLGDGEKEVIALGLERTDVLLVLDDWDARHHARALELETSGTLGILLLAKERDLLKAIEPVLDHLQKLGFRLDGGTRRIVLDLAGEN